MVASKNGRADVVDVLLQHGASVHLQDKVKLHMLTVMFLAIVGLPRGIDFTDLRTEMHTRTSPFIHTRQEIKMHDCTT